MGMSFISAAVLARMLTPTDFGILAASLIFVGLALAIFEGAFGMSLVQKAQVDEAYVSSAFWLSCSVAIVIILLIAALAPLIEGFFKFKNITAYVQVASSTILFKAIENTCESTLRRKKEFKKITTYQVICSVIGFGPISITLAYLKFGAWSLVLGTVSAAALSSLSSFVVSGIRLRWEIDREAVHDVIRSSSTFTLAQVVNWAALSGSTAIVGRVLGPAMMGLYSRSWRLLDLATYTVGAALSGVLFPTFARLQTDLDRARSALDRSLSLAVLVFGATSALLCTHAKAIVLISLGAQWTGTIQIVQILFVALVPRCCYKITESVSIGFGFGHAAARRQALYAAVMIGGAVIAAPHGPKWVAVSSSIAISVFYLSSLTKACQIVGLSLRHVAVLHLRAAAIFALVAAACYGPEQLLSGQNFWVQEIISGASGSAAAALIFAFAPASLLGSTFIDQRNRSIGFLRKWNDGRRGSDS
jgi:PST family polysaccharide transporter